MPPVHLPGQTLHYEALGPEAGDVLLLMHGFMQVGRDLLALANNLAAAGYRVILPDLPGYGRSLPPPRTFPPDFYRRDAARMGELLDALSQPRAHILGFSDGGEVALLMPLLRPDLCRSVVAWGAIGAYPPELGQYVRHAMPRTVITASHRARHPGQPVEQWQAQWIEAFCAIVDSGGDLSLDRAREIRCPLLLMVGEQDTLNPVENARRFAQAVGANGAFEYFAGAGHAIHNDQPEQFLRRVLAFLGKH